MGGFWEPAREIGGDLSGGQGPDMDGGGVLEDGFPAGGGIGPSEVLVAGSATSDHDWAKGWTDWIVESANDSGGTVGETVGGVGFI